VTRDQLTGLYNVLPCPHRNKNKNKKSTKTKQHTRGCHLPKEKQNFALIFCLLFLIFQRRSLSEDIRNCKHWKFETTDDPHFANINVRLSNSVRVVLVYLFVRKVCPLFSLKDRKKTKLFTRLEMSKTFKGLKVVNVYKKVLAIKK